MNRCRLCVMPDSRPDTEFVDGVCSACLAYQKRPEIDWAGRKQELLALLDRHDGKCIVPSSGGKDSHAQVLTLLELGTDVTVVTASTCHLTPMGRYNIDNLAKYARTIECPDYQWWRPNLKKRMVRSVLNYKGLELVGDISYPEHVSIFTTPFRMAVKLGIPLMFYGENPQNQYGGPLGSQDAKEMTFRWVSEFGGFLGLRASDFVGDAGISESDMQDYMLPSLQDIERVRVEAHFLGQYIPWDSHANAEKAIAAGMRYQLPTKANWWEWENQDNAQTGLHDYFCWLKYGYGRGCAQISVDVRAGRVARALALDWIKGHDGIFPETYMGISLSSVLRRIGMTRKQLQVLIEKFTNWEIHGTSQANHPSLAV